MKRKSTAQVFREADPDLNIIPGGSYPHRRQKKAVKLDEAPKVEMPTYTPHRMTADDWNNCPGVICPRCHQEVQQLISIGLVGKHKICKACLERKRRLIEHKRRLIDLRRGTELARLKSLRLIS